MQVSNHTVANRNILTPYGRQAGCIMTIWVDGAQVNLYGATIGGDPPRFGFSTGNTAMPPPTTEAGSRDYSGINEYLGVDQVAAIEVYQSPSEVPPRFDVGRNRCGTIVIWTGSRR